jgi:hypothetical protein
MAPVVNPPSFWKRSITKGAAPTLPRFLAMPLRQPVPVPATVTPAVHAGFAPQSRHNAVTRANPLNASPLTHTASVALARRRF